MSEYLLDCIKLVSDGQVYSILDKTENDLTIAYVDSPKELCYIKDFPLNLNVGDKAICGDDKKTEIIRIK